MQRNNIRPNKFRGVTSAIVTRKRGETTYTYKYFYSRIYQNGKAIYLGYHTTEYHAAKAYNRKAIELYGDKAMLNVFE